jgi:hypothetical protein
MIVAPRQKRQAFDFGEGLPLDAEGRTSNIGKDGPQRTLVYLSARLELIPNA